jgi:hypothetical protein
MNEIDAIRHVRKQSETQFEPVMRNLITAIGQAERLGTLTQEQFDQLHQAADRLLTAAQTSKLLK